MTELDNGNYGAEHMLKIELKKGVKIEI